MDRTSLRIQLVADAPGIVESIDALTGSIWPEFMNHDTIAAPLFGRLYRDFGQFQFGLFDGSDELIAMANTIPVPFGGTVDELPDDGWRWAMQAGCSGYDAGETPGLLSAIQICVRPDHRRMGIPGIMIAQMRALARAHNLPLLVAPVRPTMKSLYPLVAMERYVAWQRPDGSLFDPWLRTHAQAGASIIKVCPRAMRIAGRVDEWESWTGLRFPDSGDYIVAGALNPVRIDRQLNQGVYIEPNVWMHHPVD